MTEHEAGLEHDVGTAPANGVVVGHDGSAGAQHALAAAFVLADQLGVPLAVVRAWSVTTAPRPPSWTFGYVSSSDELQDAVLDALVSATEGCRLRFPRVSVSYRTPQGGPSQRLIETSQGARMLVVGSRGLGGFAELVPGSVSDQCVRYAHCPVLAVKNPQTA
jgi:nucleotide-binding universal stress UspA family protein